jgi:hypothetical protein
MRKVLGWLLCGYKKLEWYVGNSDMWVFSGHTCWYWKWHVKGSTRLKASLLLTYDYLRLYINSFAYQAAISRALSYQRDSQHNFNRPIPLINASARDARFIYEVLDAAKSLLSTFNSFLLTPRHYVICHHHTTFSSFTVPTFYTR